MAQTLTAPPLAVESLRRFTVADVYAMGEAGVLDPDERLELDHGHLLPKMPPDDDHNLSVRSLMDLFYRTVPFGPKQLQVQDPVILSEDTYYEPDLALLRPSVHRVPRGEDVLLAVEVSNATLMRDRGHKARTYAAAGVPELWVVALPERALYAYREPGADGYASVRKVEAAGEIASLAYPEARLAVAHMLPGAP